MRAATQQPLAVVSRVVTGRDDYGKDVTTQTATVIQGAFAPGGTVEDNQGRTQVIDQPTAYFPYGTVLGAVDAIVTDPVVVDSQVISGTWYEVNGDPGSWASGFTSRRFGVAVTLKRVSG